MNIISIEGPNGKTIIGSFTVDEDGRWITVKCKGREKRARLGLSTPEGLARLVLGEIACS